MAHNERGLLGVPDHEKEGGAQEEEGCVPGSDALAMESRTPRHGVGHKEDGGVCVPGTDAHVLQVPTLVTCVTLSNLAF